MNADDAELVVDLVNYGDPESVAKYEAEQKKREAAAAVEWEAHRAEREQAEAEQRENDRIEAEWRQAPDRINLGRQSYAVRQWRLLVEDAARTGSSRGLEGLLEMALKGVITDRRGRRLDGAALDRMRHRLLGTYDHLPQSRVFADRLGVGSTPDRRWLITGLLPWGTYPMLGGNPKAGKTTLVVDLVPSLIVPGRKFLDYFEVPEVPEEDFGAGLWLINAETPAEDLDGALRRELGHLIDGTWYPSEFVHVEHLQEDLGGPRMFDLTDPTVYDMWFHRLTECSVCDGSDFAPPFMLILDGLTAVLDGSTARYGEWYSKFRQLMHAVDIPNALAVGHNVMSGEHLMGGVESMAGPDGLMTYSSVNPDDPVSKRRFSVRPRLGGVAIPPTEVTISDDGRLRWNPKGKGRSPTVPSDQLAPQPSAPLEPARTTRDLVVEYVRGCNALGHGPSLTEVRANVPGRNPEVDQAVNDLVREGVLEVRARKQRGGGHAYWLRG